MRKEALQYLWADNTHGFLYHEYYKSKITLRGFSMNCWIILLLLCCYGKNNGMQVDNGCGCTGHEHHNHHEHCQNSCIQQRMSDRDSYNVKRERDYDCEEHVHNDDCGCVGEDRSREKWMPYTECNDNARRDCNCR